MDALLFIYHALVLGCLVFFLGMVIANLMTFEGLRSAPPPDAGDAPLISVLVPARNEARNIEPCVRSLLGQDYPNFELIVLDDHSDDGTAEIVRRLGVGNDETRMTNDDQFRGSELKAGAQSGAEPRTPPPAMQSIAPKGITKQEVEAPASMPLALRDGSKSAAARCIRNEGRNDDGGAEQDESARPDIRANGGNRPRPSCSSSSSEGGTPDTGIREGLPPLAPEDEDEHEHDGNPNATRLNFRARMTNDDARAGRHRLLKGRPLPAGWTGKGWACHQLAGEARGDFLFFTDADTEHAPGTVSALLAFAEGHRADLLSAWPRLVTRTWGECLVIPMILFLGFVMYPHWLVVFLQERPDLTARLPASFRRALGAANGQSMFFRRAAYEKIGGHAALSDHLVEDVALGRAVAARMGEGMRLFNCEALEFSTCRMYRSFPEVWEGFTKNMRAAFEDSLGGFLGLGGLHACAFVLPFFFLAPGWPGGALAVAQVGIIVGIRVLLTVRFRTSWWSAICHPLSEAFLMAIGLNSWRRMATKGVTWKGRTYQAPVV